MCADRTPQIIPARLTIVTPALSYSCEQVWALNFSGNPLTERLPFRTPTHELEAEAESILGNANLTQDAIDHFLIKIEKMADMCGSSEGHGLAEDEASIMHSGNMTLEEARVAKDLADYAEGFCQSEVLDVDFFVGRLADESPECNALVGSSHLMQMHKHLSILDFYAKSVMVLHDEHNKLGHHFGKRLRQDQRPSAKEIQPLLMQAVSGLLWKNLI